MPEYRPGTVGGMQDLRIGTPETVPLGCPPRHGRRVPIGKRGMSRPAGTGRGAGSELRRRQGKIDARDAAGTRPIAMAIAAEHDAGGRTRKKAASCYPERRS